MPRRPASRPASDLKPARPPRLALRFLAFTAVGLALAGAFIFVFVRSFVVAQQEQAVKYHARFVTEIVLADKLRSNDFAGPVGPARLDELNRLFRRQVLVEGVLRASLYSRDGRITYSTDRALIGRRTPDSAQSTGAAYGNHVQSSIRSELVRGRTRKVLKEFVPVRFAGSGPAGTLVTWHDYAPIARSARSAFFPISLVLELLLVGLFAALYPVFRRVTKQIASHVHETEYRALHDSLTGLPNRVLFSDRVAHGLARARRDGGRLAVMLLDLDRFKEVNDTLGHPAGDSLLVDVARRLQAVLRESDTVARLGGDEFGIVIGALNVDDVDRTAARIHDALEGPFDIEGLSVSVGASIGVALYPDHGGEPATLVKHADVAMYVAKRHRSGIEIYDRAGDANDTARLALAGELRAALERGELLVHYQPKVDLAQGRVVAAEALLRWQHPERGLLTAGEFVGVAEQTGFVKAMSRFALRSALEQAARWKRRSIDLKVAVNLDMRSLVDLELPGEIATLLAELDLDPEVLDIEITESSIMADPERVRHVALKLAAIGIQLVVDDFGTGYSSLSYLKELPIRKLKIDRSFVTRMTTSPSDKAIVRATIDLAHNLGLQVVAEGVESAEVLAALRRMGCDLGQGYYLGRPVPAEELETDLGAAEAVVA